MGSFRPVAGTRHLHRDYNFTESIVETVPKSLRLYSYGRRLLGLKFTASIALTDPLNLPAPGRRQLLYIVLRLSRNLCFW